MMDLTVGSITQLTEQQRTAWYAPELTEFVVEMGTQPDPRDARIAELEAAWGIAQKSGEGLLMLCRKQDARIAELERALREICGEIEQWQAAGIGASAYMAIIGLIVDAALQQDAQP